MVVEWGESFSRTLGPSKQHGKYLYDCLPCLAVEIFPIDPPSETLRPPSLRRICIHAFPHRFSGIDDHSLFRDFRLVLHSTEESETDFIPWPLVCFGFVRRRVQAHQSSKGGRR